jgi:hypothetical protein
MNFLYSPTVVCAPRRETAALLVKLKGEVDVGFAVQQIVEVQARPLQMHGVDLKISPVEHTVGVVV